jgi:cytochrome c oxidase cbb3-type subunit 3
MAASVVLVVLAALLIGGRLAYVKYRDGQLVRALPSQVLADPGLRRFAVWRAGPVLRSRCAVCHGSRLQGDPVRGAPNLVDREWVYGDGAVSEIERTMLYGIRSGHRLARNLADMPGFGKPVPYKRYAIPSLTPLEIGDVVEFVLAGEGRQAAVNAATRGAAVFSGKGQCFDCHTPDGTGDNFAGAPNLRDRIWMNGDGSRQAITDIVTYGRAGTCPAWGDRLRPAVIRSIAVDLHLASRREKP